ncbi:MAG TPA: universal stress protein [Longimicrobium sp.]|jgi:nucleotide-binding universal stress UspA family protein|nr:universal stress protein [Longimicrobium sp.]
MLKLIVVPLDGSQFGEHAIPTALSLAGRDRAELELVHVFEALEPFRMVQGAPVFDSDLDRDLMNDRLAYLESVAVSLGPETSAKVIPTVLVGQAKEVLAEHVERRRPDLVAMTTHGRGGLSRLWLGSVTLHLVRHVTRPVLAIRPEKEGARRPEPARFQRVLIPLDTSSEAERAIDIAVEVAGERGVEYVLVHVLVPLVWVGPEPVPPVVPNEAELLATAEGYLNEVAGRLRARGLKVQTRVLWDPHPAHAILETADEIRADLVSLETSGKRGLEKVLLGSVADKVLRGAPSPVLVQRRTA